MDAPVPAKRPKVTDRWVTLATAAALAKRLTKKDPENFPETGSEEVADQIAGVLGMGDGYEVASALEQLHGWSPNMQIAEILDGGMSLRYDLMEEAEAEWIAATKPVLLPVGARVGFATREEKTWKPLRAEGRVREVDEKHGRYVVACPALGHLTDEDIAAHKCGTHGTIVNYEDAELVPEPQP